LSKVVDVVTRTDSAAARVGMEVVFTLVFFDAVIIVNVVGQDDFHFSAEDETETVTANGFFDTRETRAVAPFVELTSESIGFEFEETKFTSGDETVTTRSVNMSDGRVDDSRFRWATDLRQVW